MNIILIDEQLQRKLQALKVKAPSALAKATYLGANVVLTEIKNTLQKGTRTGKVYKRKRGSHRASAAGEAPKTDSGRLVNSLNISEGKSLLGMPFTSVNSGVEYAHRLEEGDKKIKARPYIKVSVKRKEKQVVAIFKRIVREDLSDG